MPTIAIIGAGFTGSMLAVNLLHHHDNDLRVILIEKRQHFGRGLAYSTDNPAHLLNVPAGRMGAFPANPGHFLDWLNSHPEAINGEAQSYGPGSFVPRHLYGDYIASLLGEAAESNPTDRFHRINAQATDLSLVAGNVKIRLSNGAAITTDHAVLALGNFPPLPPVANMIVAGDRYIADPWQAGALDRITPDASVLLIGSGLTMADMAIALIGQSHRGRLDAISRHGLLPHCHAAPPPNAPVVPPFTIDELPLTARGLVNAVRRRIGTQSAHRLAQCDRRVAPGHPGTMAPLTLVKNARVFCAIFKRDGTSIAIAWRQPPPLNSTRCALQANCISTLAASPASTHLATA